MPVRLPVGGPRALAEHLADTELPDLRPADIENDIRRHPRIYYVDYAALCATKKTEPLSVGVWVDLCIG
jgi:hypothetical protein